MPIGGVGNGFKSILNGNGYTLSNLFIDRSTDDRVGLFGELQTSSTIVGIGLLRVSVRGDTRVGGLAGRAIGAVTITRSYSRGSVSGVSQVGGLVGWNRGMISNSYSSATVSGTGNYVGGLVGDNDSGTILNSYSSGSVSGVSWVGGLVGWHHGMISNSYSSGSVSGSRDLVGGLVGENARFNASGTILNSYSSGSVRGRSWVGGLVGRNQQARGTIRNSYSLGSVSSTTGGVGGLVGHNQGGTISNSYWDILTSQSSYSDGGIGKTTAMLQEPIAAIGIYREWSEADWDFGTAQHYPAIKYAPGPDASNPACSTPSSPQPACGNLLPGQKRIQVFISTTALAAINVAEDNIIILEAAPGYSISDAMQIEGNPLSIATINASKRWVVVPPDLVAEGANRMTLRFQMTINDGMDTQQTTVSVVVVKINNGNAVLGLIDRSGNDLTVPMIDLSSDVDSGVVASSIRYQWQRCLVGEDCLSEAGWSDTRGTSRSYSLAELEARRNNRFRVIVSYRDGQGYSNEVISRSIAYLARPDTVAPVFTMDWSRFPGGAIAVCNDGDIDNDNDGLIEICHLEDLDAIRYELDGSGYQFYGDAEKSTKGCGLDGCNGYELVRDLDFNDNDSYLSTTNRARWTTNTGWFPIGSLSDRFRGLFNGNGYTLSNLLINRPSDGYVGLFGVLSSSGTITRIDLSDARVHGNTRVGGLVGRSYGTITRIAFSGRVSGTRWIGGLVGSNLGPITESHSSGTVSGGTNLVGGLAGWNGAVISNSGSRGAVSGGSIVGGLVGWNAGTINNSDSNGSIRGDNDDAGGLAGANIGTISNSYNRAAISGAHRVGGLVGSNIKSGGKRGIITDSYSSGAVSGNSDVGGLVGNNRGSVIRNSHNSGRVTGKNAVGGLVGMNLSATILNSYNRAAVGGNHRVGGLAGRQQDGGISNSYNSGAVSSDNDHAGGLVGMNGGGRITLSYNHGAVTGARFVGGLVGDNGETFDNNSTETPGGPISDSYNSGTVSGTENVGGLAGQNKFRGLISNSYNSATVSGTENVGGLVGINTFATDFPSLNRPENFARIISSYSIGRVTSTGTRVGGLVGENKAFVGNSSYWDIETSHWLTSAGGTSQTTVALQTPTTAGGIYQTWDSDVWDFGTDIQYPRLKYTTGTDVNNPACGIPKYPACSSLLAGQRVREVAIATEGLLRMNAVEGETVVLNAATDYSTFRWTQIGTPTLALGTTNTAELRFLLPADVVSREATTRLLTIRLTVSTGTTIVRQQTVQIVVNKVDNDVVTSQPTIIRSKNRLIVEPNFLATDEDGVGTIQTYQWQKCLDSEVTTMICSRWGDISSDGTNAFYLVPKGSVVEGDQFRVKLTYTDGQGYSYSTPINSTAFAYQLAVFLRLKLFLEGALQ